jgi:ribosome biogenesis GTPase A
MTNYWDVVNKVIDKADILLLVLDSRFVDQTRNEELEQKILSEGKKLIYVMTKCDLVEKDYIEKIKDKLRPSVFVSSKKFLGTTMLKEKIIREGYLQGIKDRIKVGVLGYPNVGKSSLINAMKGRKAAPTSITSGQTRGVQNINAGSKIVFLDTPGVIPYSEKDKNKHALTGSVDFAKTKEPDMAVMSIMEQCPGKIEKYYDVEVSEDKEQTLEQIALKKKVILKAGEPDTKRMAVVILKEWQTGKIKTD